MYGRREFTVNNPPLLENRNAYRVFLIRRPHSQIKVFEEKMYQEKGVEKNEVLQEWGIKNRFEAVFYFINWGII